MKIGTVQSCRGLVAMEKHPVEDQPSLSRCDRSRRFKIAIAGTVEAPPEAIHEYDERVVVEGCGVAEAR
jgi:hypothetical protein